MAGVVPRRLGEQRPNEKGVCIRDAGEQIWDLGLTTEQAGNSLLKARAPAGQRRGLRSGRMNVKFLGW